MYLLDTNILSEFYRGNQEVIEKLTSCSETELSICNLVLCEIFFGIERCPDPIIKSKLKEFYIPFTKDLFCFEFDKSCIFVFAKVKNQLLSKGNTVENFDIAIASVALKNKLTLVTKNIKHFDKIEGLMLETW